MKLFEGGSKKEERRYEPLPMKQPKMDWEVLFGKEMVVKDGSVASTNKLLQHKRFVALFFTDFSTKEFMSASLPFANTLSQYYSQLKEKKHDDELEVISVDINQTMTVTYSRYYLDLPWLVIEVSNLLLRQALIQEFHTSVNVPQLVILSQSGKVVDSEACEVIEKFSVEFKLLSEYYPDERSNSKDYEVYASFTNDEAIPSFPSPSKGNPLVDHEPKHRSVSRDPQNPHQSMGKGTFFNKLANSLYKDGPFAEPTNQGGEQKQNSLEVVNLSENTATLGVDPLPTPATVVTRGKANFHSGYDGSIDIIRVKQLLLVLPTLPHFRRQMIHMELSLFPSIFNARKEVAFIDILLEEAKEQFELYFHPTNRHRSFQQLSIKNIIESVRRNESLLGKLTYTQDCPYFPLGVPNQQWERDICKELHLLHSDWESKLSAIQRDSEDLHACFQQTRSQYQEEYTRYLLGLQQWCKVTKVDRESTARTVDTFWLLLAIAIALCIPVIVGVLIGVYAK